MESVVLWGLRVRGGGGRRTHVDEDALVSRSLDFLQQSVSGWIRRTGRCECVREGPGRSRIKSQLSLLSRTSLFLDVIS